MAKVALQQFELFHFKNYTRQRIDCSGRLNCFVGRNGAGKTNLLEAIYYLCMGKSYSTIPDQYLIQHGADFFRLQGNFRRDERKEEIVIKAQPRKRKVIERNDVPYTRLADHVGRYPVVIIIPDDTELVQEGSEERRRILDNTISQIDAQYLQHLINYNRIHKQRNALLKQYDGQRLPETLLQVYDLQLEPAAAYIHARRRGFTEQLSQQLSQTYAAISGGREEVALAYKSQLNEQAFLELQAARRQKDSALQRTTGGIHRDDLVFSMHDHPLKRIASQGQLKSFVLALKLAQYQVLKAEKGMAPLLLLDDIFDKLDHERVGQLLALILQDDYGQIFISDTDPERVERLARAFTDDWRQYLIEQGYAQPH